MSEQITNEYLKYLVKLLIKYAILSKIETKQKAIQEIQKILTWLDTPDGDAEPHA